MQAYNRVGLIPAAGRATRLGGLPKFLLPLMSSSLGPNTLLSYHIEMQKKICSQVVVCTRPEFAQLVYPITQDSGASLVIQETETMSETVLGLTQLMNGDEFVLSMPDTFFTQNQQLEPLSDGTVSEDLTLQCWKVLEHMRGQVGEVNIRDNQVVNHSDKNEDSNFSHMWGAMKFRRTYLNFVRPGDAHIGIGIGRAIKNSNMTVSGYSVAGEYLDLGTPGGLKRFLSERM